MNASAIRSNKSDKTIGTASGLLVLQYPCDEEVPETDIEQVVSRLGQAIDESSLHRQGAVQVQRNERNLRLSCTVAYGPVFGACKSDLEKKMRTFAKAFDRSCETRILNYSRKDNTREELEAHITAMERRMNDLDTPLAMCDQLSREIARLRGVLD